MKRFSMVVLLAAAATSIPMLGASAAESAGSVPMTITYVGCSRGRVITVQVQIPTGRFYVGPPTDARCVTGR